MKKLVLVTILLIAICVCLFAATQQWEYMVLTFGKSIFSDYNVRALAYLDEGIRSDVMEAKSIEKSLDILGKHGWEIVDITGTIGGDQQITLKRAYDQKTTEAELKLAADNQAKLDKASQTLAEYAAQNTIEEPSGPRELIELDEVDLANAQAAESDKKSKEIYNSTKTVLDNNKIKNYTITTRYNASSEFYSVSIYLDVTSQFLINGDSYRKSQTDAYLKQFESIIKAISFDKKKSAFFYVYAQIELDGKKNTVSTGNTYFRLDYKGNEKWDTYEIK